jgi:uncharacterized membrane protein
MENQEQNNSMDNMWRKAQKSHRRGKVVAGILVASAGALFLGRALGMEIPNWLLTLENVSNRYGCGNWRLNMIFAAQWHIF